MQNKIKSYEKRSGERLGLHETRILDKLSGLVLIWKSGVPVVEAVSQMK